MTERKTQVQNWAQRWGRRWVQGGRAAIGMMLAAASLSAVASGSTEAQADDFVVGVEEIMYFPYYAVDNGEYVGFARELFDAFGKATGHNFSYRPLSVPRLYKELLSQEIDFKFPDSPYWQQGKKQGFDLHYSAQVVEYVDGVMVTPNRLGKPKAAIQRLGTVRGFTPWAWMGEIKNHRVTIVENSSFTGLLNQAIRGRVDGVYSNVNVAEYQLSEFVRNPNGLVFDSGLPHVRDYYHLSTIKHQGVLDQFGTWMKENKPLVSLLKQKYGLE